MENEPLIPISSTQTDAAADWATGEASSQSEPAGNSRVSMKSRIAGNPAYLILPVIILFRLAVLLPSTTMIEVSLKVICQIYWDNQNPPVLPGDITEEMCKEPVIQKSFAVLIQFFAVFSAVAGFVCCGLTSHFSGKLGRKPVLMFFLVSNIISVALMLVALRSRGIVQIVLLLLYFPFTLLGQATQFDLIVNMFVVDLTPPDERTAVLSLVGGAGALGSLPAFIFGGMITERTHSLFSVYYVSLAILASVICMTWVFLPESFTADKRQKLREEQEAETHHGRTKEGNIIVRIKSMITTTLHPLVFLWPAPDINTGKRNLRVLWCAIHAFIGSLGSGYIATAMIIYLTTKAGFKPEDNGLVLTTLASSTVISLLVVTPLIFKYIRPLVDRSPKDGSSKNTSFEIAVIVISWLVDMSTVASLPLVRTRLGLFIVISLHGLSSSRSPAFRTVTVASVEPVRSGEAMSAVDMSNTLGTALSSLVLGSILSATIATYPPVTFWTYSCFGILAVLVLAFIKDSDKYAPPPSLELDEPGHENEDGDV